MKKQKQDQPEPTPMETVSAKEYLRELVGPIYNVYIDRWLPSSFATDLVKALENKKTCEYCKIIVGGMKHHNYCYNCGRKL